MQPEQVEPETPAQTNVSETPDPDIQSLEDSDDEAPVVEAGPEDFSDGGRVLGRVVALEADGAVLEARLGDATVRSRLPAREVALVDGGLRVGDDLDVFVERSLEDPEIWLASAEKAASLAMWDALCRAVDGGTPVEGDVIGKVKGGLAVDIGVRAFLPASQASLRPGVEADGIIGKRLPFEVIEFNRKRGNIVVSLKKHLEAEQNERRQAVLSHLSEGEVVNGTVRSLTDYGAFVDLGGIDGLVHVTDLSWARIRHPSEAVKVGDSLKVKVLKIDTDRDRISLGVKQLLPDPWASVPDRFPVGSRITGPVVSLMDYGAFVELEPGVDGLVHATELSWTRRVNHPSELLTVGEVVTAQVLDVDQGQRRIALGIKQTQENPWEAFKKAHPVGSRVKGVVRRIKDFGLFVETEAGLDGLIRTQDLMWAPKQGKSRDEYQIDEPVEAMVLEIEPKNERLALGIKQLSEDPWKSLAARFPPGSRVKGKVVKAVEFGLFVEIEPGIEGLCHISQLSNERVERSTDIAKEGDELEVAVVEIDRDKRRIALSVKALAEEPGDYRAFLTEQDTAPAKPEARFSNSFGAILEKSLKK